VGALLVRLRAGLLGDVPFRRYWVGQGASLIGDQVRMLALPLTAVLALHADATGMALLSACGSLPWLLFGLHAGSWVDRRGRRRQTMLWADALRALLLIAVPVAFLLHVQSMAFLVLVSFLVGTCTVLFRVSASTLFVALVPQERYVEASSLLSGSRALAFFVGPGIGGYLVQWLTAPFALLADAASFVVSAVALGSIRPAEPLPAARARGEVLEGLRYLRTVPILRASFAAQATVSLFGAIFGALYVLYGTRVLHVTPADWGIILGPSSIGALAATGLARRLSGRIGVGRTLLLGTVLFTAPLLLVPLAGGAHAAVVATLFVAEGLAGAGSMIREIASGTIQAVTIPDAVRARVTAAFSVAGSGLSPIGALLAGGVAALIGLHPTILLATAGGAMAFLWLLRLPLGQLRSVEDLAASAPCVRA